MLGLRPNFYELCFTGFIQSKWCNDLQQNHVVAEPPVWKRGSPNRFHLLPRSVSEKFKKINKKFPTQPHDILPIWLGKLLFCCNQPVTHPNSFPQKIEQVNSLPDLTMCFQTTFSFHFIEGDLLAHLRFLSSRMDGTLGFLVGFVSHLFVNFGGNQKKGWAFSCLYVFESVVGGFAIFGLASKWKSRNVGFLDQNKFSDRYTNE